MNYVCLDVGDVLVHVNFQIFIDALSKQQNITLEEAEYFMNRTHSLHDLGLTKMSDELRDHFKIRSPIIMKDLLETWDRVITPNLNMISRFNSMVEKNHLQVALLSNVGLEHAKQMEWLLSGGAFFKKCVKHLSCQVGARKPTKLYYQSFLMQHPEFEGCAYLDDLEENLQMGAEFGFRPFQFSLAKELEQTGIPEVTPGMDKLKEIERFILGNTTKNSRRH